MIKLISSQSTYSLNLSVLHPLAIIDRKLLYSIGSKPKLIVKTRVSCRDDVVAMKRMQIYGELQMDAWN